MIGGNLYDFRNSCTIKHNTGVMPNGSVINSHAVQPVHSDVSSILGHIGIPLSLVYEFII